MTESLVKRINIHRIVQIIMFICLIVIDRLTKYFAVTYLKGSNPVSIIRDVIELRYLENSGAAFGIFQNMQWMFYIITAVILVIIIYLWISLFTKLKNYCALPSSALDDSGKQKIFRKKTYSNIIFLNYLLTALAAGAVGNLIDRVLQKYVVDFIYFKIIDFPIFNFADICVTITAALLIIFFLFIYKDDPGFSIFRKKDEADNIHSS